MKRILFFAVRKDLILLLDDIERRGPLKFIRMGQFLDSVCEEFNSGANLPNLGTANADSAINCASFLVTYPETTINVRKILSHDSRPRFIVDQLMNPDTVVFTPAGTWNDEIVLNGLVATNSQSRVSHSLMRRFQSAMTKNFSRVKAFHVGSGARDLLFAGKRLTIAVQSPNYLDLSLEE